MITNIPQQIIEIYSKLHDKGSETYFVGGCVRNILMGMPVKDWDLTTIAIPNEIKNVFPNSFYDNAFGTVGVPLGDHTNKEDVYEKNYVEITTFRVEGNYKDWRHPQVVQWGKSIEDDLSRRDFTINAIALRPKTNNPTTISDFEIIDPFNGQKDLENKIVRAVGDPKQRFKEDALRLMRGVRIATEYGFNVEENTWKEIINDVKLIKEVSGERIQTELLKILATNHPYEGVMLLKNSGLLQYTLPELLKGVGVSQVRPDRHHTSDVFTHNVLSLKFCLSNDPIVRFATLLHDVGKPQVAQKDEQGLVIFHNHEIVGSRIARQICDRLHFSRKDRDKIVNLIRWHMFTVDEKITDAAVRRFIRRVGVESVKDIMDLRIGDRLGGGTQTAESWRLKLFKKRIEEQLKPAPFSINDLAIDGSDVMKELSIKPGRKVGQILKRLFEEVDEDLSKNNKEYLLRRIREIKL